MENNYSKNISWNIGGASVARLDVVLSGMPRRLIPPRYNPPLLASAPPQESFSERAGVGGRRYDDGTPEFAWERDYVLDTDRSWPLFVYFRDLPPRERTYERVARDCNISVNQVREYAHRALWAARAAEKDRSDDREVCRVLLADKRGAARRHLNVAMGLLEVAAAETKRLLEEVRKPDAARRLKPKEIVQLAEFAIKYERLVRGAVTERIGVEDLQTLTDEELAMAKRLREKLDAAGGDSGAPDE